MQILFCHKISERLSKTRLKLLVVYEGNLTDEFIASVRRNDFELDEGVICKGTQGKGSYRGKVWMAKIKTQAYLDRLKNRFGDEWSKYGE